MSKLRGILAGLAMLAALVPAAAARADSNPQFSTVVQAGYGGAAPSGGWVPVEVDVTNHGPDTRATLKISLAGSGNGYRGGPIMKPIPVPAIGGVSTFVGGVTVPGPFGPGGQQGGTFTKQLKVVLPAGSTKHFTAYLPAVGGTARGEVVSTSGKSLATSQTQLAAGNSSLSVAVVSDSTTALNQIGSIQSLNQTFQTQPQIIHVSVSALPDNPAALSGFGLVAFTNASTEPLSSAQRQALDDYVAQGGAVLVSGGSAWHNTLAGLPADLVLLAPSSVTTLPGLPGVSAALGTSLASGPVDVATGTRRGGVADFAEGQIPILLEAPLGQGEVLFSAVDLSAEPLASWSGSLPLLRQILVRSQSVSGKGIQAKGSSIFQALSNIPSLDLPSPTLIAIALAAFILLVGPVNFLVLRRLRRPDLAWVTIPVLVVASAGSIYGIGLKTRGTDVLADRIRVVYLRNGSNRAYVNSGTGVFAPHAGTHTVATVEGSLLTSLSGGVQFFGGPMGMPLPFAASGPSGALTIVDGAPQAVLLNWPNADTIQAFGEEYAETEPGGLESHLSLVNGRITGTVLNHLQTAVTSAVAISGSTFRTLGPVRPGGSMTIDIPLPAAVTSTVTNGPVSTLAQQIYMGTATIQSSRPSASQRQAQRRSAVLSAILAADPYASTPMLVAWTAGPAASTQVTVDGGRAQLNQLDAYVLPLTPDSLGTSLPPGAVPGRVIDATGQIPSKAILPAGFAFFAPDSQETLEFSLGSVGWHRLMLTDTQPTGAPMPFAGTPGTAVFNFRTSAWDQITMAANQPVDIPSPADHVSPDGLVRVRLTTGRAPSGVGTLDISGERTTT